eukprot:4439529-Pyramimonas_sp.AAC.1
MVEYCQHVLAIRDKQHVAPQVRAGQAHKCIKQLEKALSAEPSQLEKLQKQVTEQEAKVTELLGQIEKQEAIYTEAVKELHAVVVPPVDATQAQPTLSLEAMLEGKQEWTLSCGEDLFGLAEFVDVEETDKVEARKREVQLKEQFQSLAK